MRESAAEMVCSYSYLVFFQQWACSFYLNTVPNKALVLAFWSSVNCSCIEKLLVVNPCSHSICKLSNLNHRITEWFDFLGCKCRFLDHVELLIQQHPQILLSRAILGLDPPTCDTRVCVSSGALNLIFLNLMRFLWTRFSSLSRSHWFFLGVCRKKGKERKKKSS